MFIFGLIMLGLLVSVLVIIVKSLKKHERGKSKAEKFVDEEAKRGKDL